MNPAPLIPRQDPYAALRHRHFLFYALGSTLANLGSAMQSVAVGWDLYEQTGSAMVLGGVGLVQFLPIILLAVPAGHTADRFDRRRILLVAEGVMACCSVALAVLSACGAPLLAIYACLGFSAVSRAFATPAAAGFWTALVPTEHYSNAITWRSSGFQIASVIGPALGGLLIGWQHQALPAYLADAGLTLTFWLFLYRTPSRGAPRSPVPTSFAEMLAGFRFVWRTKVILSAVTLDMLAVLFGGAVALLPIFAKDILHVGPTGFGLLRSAPGIGALIMAFVITHRRPPEHAGRAMLWSVAGFGLATIVFGFSRSFWLSMIALAFTGALDTISVVVRHSLVQLRTPDAMRGRVSSVNSVFISCSNELGAFESGAIAALWGPIISAVAGGMATLAVVAVVALLWPDLRRLGRLHDPETAKT